MEQVLEALQTGAGMLWKALWGHVFGYTISAAIQVVVTRGQMARAMGRRGLKELSLAGVFGFLSSSCSFAALAASRTVLVKGAHPAAGGLALHAGELPPRGAHDRLRVRPHAVVVPRALGRAGQEARREGAGAGFFIEWKMVWKEILFGFTLAGFIAVFVP